MVDVLNFEQGTRLRRFYLQWGRKAFAMMREKEIRTTMPAPLLGGGGAPLYYHC